MPRSRPRAARLKNALAFVFTITIGIAAGCVWTIAEAVAVKLKPGKRPSSSSSRSADRT